MLESYTAVIERATPIRGAFESEPYESAWASEALVFVKVRQGLSEDQQLTSRVQISPDGIDWVDHGAKLPPISGKGMAYVAVERFGGWLRVVGEVSDAESPVLASVYIVLKG